MLTSITDHIFYFLIPHLFLSNLILFHFTGQRLKRKHLQDDTVLAPRAKWRRLMAASQAPEPVESRIDPHTIGGQRPGLQAPTMFNLSATQGGSLNISNARDPPVRKYPQTTNAPSGSVSRPPTKSPHPPRKS